MIAFFHQQEANGLPGVFQDMGLKEVVVGLDREVVVGLDREDGDSVKNFAALYGESGGDGQCLWKEGRSGRPVIRQHVVSFPKSNDADGGSQDDQVRGCVWVVALSPGLTVDLWMIR